MRDLQLSVGDCWFMIKNKRQVLLPDAFRFTQIVCKRTLQWGLLCRYL